MGSDQPVVTQLEGEMQVVPEEGLTEKSVTGRKSSRGTESCTWAPLPSQPFNSSGPGIQPQLPASEKGPNPR